MRTRGSLTVQERAGRPYPALRCRGAAAQQVGVGGSARRRSAHCCRRPGRQAWPDPSGAGGRRQSRRRVRRRRRRRAPRRRGSRAAAAEGQRVPRACLPGVGDPPTRLDGTNAIPKCPRGDTVHTHTAVPVILRLSRRSASSPVAPGPCRPSSSRAPSMALTHVGTGPSMRVPRCIVAGGHAQLAEDRRDVMLDGLAPSGTGHPRSDCCGVPPPPTR